MRSLLLIPIFLVSVAVASGATIYVPDNYLTIQEAVDAASSGDTIIVRIGTYSENVVIDDKPLTLRSESGPEMTIVDGSTAGPVFSIVDNWGDPLVIEGFTIRNGRGTLNDRKRGTAGIDFCGDYATIRNNIIEDNGSTTWGTGVYIFGADSEITGNAIRNNTGNGIFFEDGCGVVTDNKITNNIGSAIYINSYKSAGCRKTPAYGKVTSNYIAENGGGVFAGNDSSALVSGNTIVDNFGIGIRFDYSFLDAIGNLIARNSGSGIACSDMTDGYIVDNLILDNMAPRGAGIYCDENYNWGLFVANNIISGNVATNEGGGIWFGEYEKGVGQANNPCIINNTITFNSASNAGGGIYCGAGASALIANTILWNNFANEGKEIWLGHSWWPSTMDVHHSDVEGGQNSCHVESGCTLNWGDGMIDSDPLFAESFTDDYHLTWLSPCRDTGANAAATEPYDFEGDPRVMLDTVDMGADEYCHHLYSQGSVIPGETVSVRVVGWPDGCTKLLLGSGIKDPPQPTAWGMFYLESPVYLIYLGLIPSNGILTQDMTIPSAWGQGESYPFQAFIGSPQWQSSRLTNLMVLTVE